MTPARKRFALSLLFVAIGGAVAGPLSDLVTDRTGLQLVVVFVVALAFGVVGQWLAVRLIADRPTT